MNDQLGTFCECGCGEPVFPTHGRHRRFVKDHFPRTRRQTYAIEDRGYVSPCWIWQGTLDRKGYARLTRDGRKYFAHRFYYEQHIGAIPDGLTLDHLCRNPACVNPAHLEAVTHRENCLRGTSPFAINAARTHCANGHPLSGANLAISSRGFRRCRRCTHINTNASERRSRARQAA